MQKLFFPFWFTFLIFAFLFLIFDKSSASHFPTPTGFVNDFANLFSQDFKTSLEQDLQNFEKETGAEIALVTIQNLGAEPIEDFAVKLFEEWGIGKRDENNGVLLLIAKDEREVRIEVGYGLEPYITDGRAGRIMREKITPNFRNGAYDEGIKEAVIKPLSPERR